MRLWSWWIHRGSLSGGTTMPQLPWWATTYGQSLWASAWGVPDRTRNICRPPAWHHPEVQCQYGCSRQAGPKHQPLADPDRLQKEVLLNCDMAIGHCSSGMPGICTGSMEEFRLPWTSGGNCVCYPQDFLRGSQEARWAHQGIMSLVTIVLATLSLSAGILAGSAPTGDARRGARPSSIIVTELSVLIVSKNSRRTFFSFPSPLALHLRLSFFLFSFHKPYLSELCNFVICT